MKARLLSDPSRATRVLLAYPGLPDPPQAYMDLPGPRTRAHPGLPRYTWAYLGISRPRYPGLTLAGTERKGLDAIVATEVCEPTQVLWVRATPTGRLKRTARIQYPGSMHCINTPDGLGTRGHPLSNN